MSKKILPIIIVLEIAMIFVFCILKRNYTYDGYTFHLDNVNIYSVSSGESSVGEKILVMLDGSVEFRENLYTIRMSGYRRKERNNIGKKVGAFVAAGMMTLVIAVPMMGASSLYYFLVIQLL